MVGWILFILTLILLILTAFIAYRFYRRAVVLDEVFQYISGDIDINLKQFKKMSTSTVTANEPEITAAHNNMMIMSKRLDEILYRMEQATGLSLRPPPVPPRPKVR